MDSGCSKRRAGLAVASAWLIALAIDPLAGCASAPSRAGQSQSTQTPPPSKGSAEQLKQLMEQQRVGAETPPAAQETPPQSEPAVPLEARSREPADANGKLPDWLHGSLAVRYRGRWSGDDKDHTLGGYLTLDASDPTRSTTRGHVEARVDVDFEGDDEGEVFGDLSDTYDSAIVPKLYLAYGELGFDSDPALSTGTVRIGRQLDTRLPEFVRLDGVSVATKPKGENELELGAYGGVPVHLYEDDTDSGRAYGVFAEGRPWKEGRARFDWMHLEDDLVLGEHEDDLLALALWQKVSDHVRVEGEYSHLEKDPRDLRLRGFVDDPESQTLLRVQYYQLLETQTANANEIDPYFEQLFEYFPFRQATINVARPLGEKSSIDLGFDMRRVTDSDDVGEFNRDWERYYATFTRDEIFEPELAVSLTVDWWDDDDRDTRALGADLTYTPNERWETAIGTYYSLYKYDFLEFDERDDVRTYYVRAGYDLSASVDLDVRYEYEDDDFDTYHTLRLGALWQF